MLSIKLLSDDMAELAFQIDLFSCCACFSDLEATDMVSFFYPFRRPSIWDHRMHRYLLRNSICYLEAMFDSKAARTAFNDDNIWSNFANASKVERLDGTSKPSEL